MFKDVLCFIVVQYLLQLGRILELNIDVLFWSVNLDHKQVILLQQQ
jgi:hypothetical protein